MLHHPQVEKHLKRLWSGAFRAMDDIKETVRISGDKLCRAVTSLTTRLCDVSLTDMSDAHKAMDIVLPFLLAEGILSKVDSVRKASIGVVMKLTKVRNVCYAILFSIHVQVLSFLLSFSATRWRIFVYSHLSALCRSDFIDLCRDLLFIIFAWL